MQTLETFNNHLVRNQYDALICTTIQYCIDNRSQRVEKRTDYCKKNTLLRWFRTRGIYWSREKYDWRDTFEQQKLHPPS